MTKIKQTNKRVELNIQQKLEIIEKFNNGTSAKKLAGEYGVCLQTVQIIVQIGSELMTCDTSTKRKNRKYEPKLLRKSARRPAAAITRKSKLNTTESEDDNNDDDSSDEDFIEPAWLKEMHKSKDENLNQGESSKRKTNVGDKVTDKNCERNDVTVSNTNEDDTNKADTKQLDEDSSKDTNSGGQSKTNDDNKSKINDLEAHDENDCIGLRKRRRVSRKPANYSQYETDFGTDGSDNNLHISSEDYIGIVVEPKNKKSMKKHVPHVVLSIDKKLEILDKLKNGVSVEDLSAEYGVAFNTIRDIVARKDEYQRFGSSVKNLSGVKQMILPIHDQLTSVMLKWYNEQKQKCKSLYYEDFVKQSQHIFIDLQLQKRVRVTSNWFEKFLTYFGIIKESKEEIIILKDKLAEIEPAWVKDIHNSKDENLKQGHSSNGTANECETVIFEDDTVTDKISEINVMVSNVNDTKQLDDTSKDTNSGQSQINDNKSKINDLEACDDNDCIVLRKGRRASRKPANYSQYETNFGTDGSDSDFHISSEDDIGFVVEPKNKKSTKKRATRVVLSIDKKLEILDKLENGDSMEDLSVEYGVAFNTIRDMITRKDEYQRFASSVKNLSGVKQIILPVHDQLTCAMLKWYNEQRNKCKSVYYEDFVKQSQHIFVDLRLQRKVQVTSNWFEKFLTYFGIAKESKEEIIISKDKQAEIEEKRVRSCYEKVGKEVEAKMKKPKVEAAVSSGKKKRKRVELNIQGKLKIIEAFENGATALELSEKYGIGHQTVKDIVRTSEEYKEFAARPDFNATLKRVFYQTTRRKEGKQRVSNNVHLETRRTQSLSNTIQGDNTEHNYSTLQEADLMDSQNIDSDDQSSAENTVDRLKRKRVVLSIEKRLEVIERMDNGEDVLEIANDHNVSQQTIRDIYTRKAELKEFAAGLSENMVKRKAFMSKPLYSQLDEPMLTWYKKQQAEGNSVTPTDIALKARDVFTELNMKGKFRAGRWFKLFIKRHKIQKMKIVKNTSRDDVFHDSDVHSESGDETDAPTDGKEDVEREAVVKRKKRRRVVLDIDQKLELLEQIENGVCTIEEVSNEYGVACGTIRDWLHRRGRLQSFAPPVASTPFKRRYKLTYDDLNKEVLKWYHRQPDQEAITDDILTIQARQLFTDLKMGGNFVASPKWLQRFKEEYLNAEHEDAADGEDATQLKLEEHAKEVSKNKTAKECLENFVADDTLTDSEAPNNDSLMEPCANIHIQYVDADGKEVLEDIPIFLEAGTNMEKQKRKRVRLTIEQKLELIKRLESGESVTEIAYDYGIAFTTVREIAQKKEDLIQFANCPLMKSRKSAKKTSYCDLDDSILSWYKEEEEKGTQLNSSTCIEKAKELSVSLGLEGKFKPTQGWFVRFQQRHEIGGYTDDERQLTPSWFQPLDEAMIAWYKEQEELGADLNQSVCAKQAAELFVTLDLRGLFHPSSEWFESFLLRHGLGVHIKHDETTENITIGMESLDNTVAFEQTNPTDNSELEHIESEIKYVVNTKGEPVTEISIAMSADDTNSAAQLRKRNLLSLAKKLELIEQVEKGVKVRQVALDYNIGQQTVRDIILKKDKLLSIKNGIKSEKTTRKKRKDAGISKRCVQIQYVNADGDNIYADIPLPMTQKQESNEKRKRVVLSIEKKMQIIKQVEAGAKVKDVAFENGIGSQTVRDIILKKEKFSQYSPFTNRKTLRGANFVELENAMLEWYNEQEALGLDVSTVAGMKHADYLATTMTLTTFTATKCWYSRFKHRHGLGVWKNDSEVSAYRENLMGPTESYNLPNQTQTDMIIDTKDGQLLQLTQDDLYHIEHDDNLTFGDSDMHYDDDEQYDQILTEKVSVEEIAIVFEKDNDESKPDVSRPRRVRLTIEDKLHVIGMSDEGIDVEAIAIEKGVSKQQVKDIITNRGEILEFSLNHTTNRYSMKKSNYEKLDKEMLTWYNQRLAMGLPMSNSICTKQAHEFFESMGMEGTFKTTRWLPRLKQLCEQQEAAESLPQMDVDEPEEQKIVTEMPKEEANTSTNSDSDPNVSGDLSHGKIASYLDTILHYIEDQQDVRISDKRMLKRLFNKTRRKGIAANNTL